MKTEVYKIELGFQWRSPGEGETEEEEEVEEKLKTLGIPLPNDYLTCRLNQYLDFIVNKNQS